MYFVDQIDISRHKFLQTWSLDGNKISPSFAYLIYLFLKYVSKNNSVSLNVSIQNSFKSSINKYPSGPEHLSKANKINRNDFIGFLVARYMSCSCSNTVNAKPGFNENNEN